MNAFRIAWMLFKNNFKLYRFYFVVLIFATGIYYNFLAIIFNPYISVLNEQYSYAQTASVLCSIVLFFTMFFFMIHASNFFYKLRYKEIGIYMLTGIQSSKVGRVFAIESIFLGSSAVLVGIPIGILFSKLFFMLLGKAMILNTKIPFYIPFRAISTLVLILVAMILFLGLKNYWMVRRSRIIEILHADKKEQKKPKLKWISGGMGVVCIITGYMLASNIQELKMDFLSVSILILILVCIGTYIFFGSFLSIILQMCIENKRLIYKGSRLISFSNTLFRLGTHYRSFAMTAILSACTLAAFSGSLGLKYYADSNTKIEAPYSISYMNQNEAIRKRIKKLIENSSHQIGGENQSHFIMGKISYDGRAENCLITSLSEVKKALKVILPQNAQKIIREIQIQDQEMISILHSNLLFSGSSRQGNMYRIQEKSYTLKKEMKIPFIGEMSDIGQYETYIVTDKEYNALRKGRQEIVLNGINFTNPEDSKELVIKIGSIMEDPKDNLNSFAEQYEYKYYLIGSFYFLGLVMAMIFMIATFSTIYFKILSDGILDREQYKMLMKIGMLKEEIARSIYTQVGIAFVLPVFVGILHSIMAMKALETFMHFRFTGSIYIGIGVFVVGMVTFYIFISRKYIDMVYGE